ncbi:hypothetical protein [Clostridium sp. Marseille-Q7071]
MVKKLLINILEEGMFRKITRDYTSLLYNGELKIEKGQLGKLLQ